MSVFHPRDARGVAEVITWAAAEGATLELLAGGSKRRLGRPPQTDHQLDLSLLAGIIDYDPPELVLTARAATPMATIAEALDEAGQMLAFEPPDWRSLLGSTGEPTLGGVLACNLAGPRRVRAGAARDHFLGFAAVNGWGDAWKAGGRVVKNVTGYDLCKLQAGAYGTLSALTEVTVRVMPRPETSCSLVLHGRDDAAALSLMAQALNTQHEVSAAAHLPPPAARRAGLASRAAATVLRLEGPAPSVAFRAATLQALLGEADILDAPASGAFWAAAGAVAPLLATEGRCVWRLCPTPSAAAEVRARLPDAEAFYDWGGGLLWLATDSGAEAVRAALRPAGGHAMLVAAPDDVRAATAVFEPLPAPLAALTARVKANFDPRGILNPGRMS